MSGVKLTKQELETLRDVKLYDRSGYHLAWRPKTIAKLAAAGLVERSGAGHRITPAGRAALSTKTEGGE